MTREDVIKRIKRILEECKEYNEDDEIAVCYVTSYDADALDLAIEALEQETVSRESYDHEFFLRKELEVKIARLENTIKELEQGQKTGQWVFVDKAHEHAYCSECGYGNVDLFNGRPHNYCPNCGAKMDEDW